MVVAVLAAAPASAQVARTFVSGNGADGNPCSRASPCRSFAYAIGQTSAGGDITVLDPAGYGSLTITKAISIVNDGVGEAAVTATTGDAITINAGSSDVVNLRGLTITGSSTSGSGITFNSGGTLNIQNSVIRGFGNVGINFIPSVSSTLNVSDTIESGNLSAGIYVGPIGGATVYASFVRTQVNGNNGPGFEFVSYNPTLQAELSDCLASNNSGDGVLVVGTESVPSTVTIVDSVLFANGNAGVEAVGSLATVLLSGTTTAGNGSGFQNEEAVTKTFANNFITESSNTGTLTSISPK
jgi:hypothetical protein